MFDLFSKYNYGNLKKMLSIFMQTMFSIYNQFVKIILMMRIKKTSTFVFLSPTSFHFTFQILC